MSGLEALGVAASIIQVVDIGFKLSKNIYNYVDTASSTDDRLARIAKHVDLTTEVVRRVAEVFESEAEAESESEPVPGKEKEKKRTKVVNQEALRLGRDVAMECETVFERLMGEVGRLKENPRRYYKFPFKESKFALWEAQLEKLKTTLNCLMNVLILAQALKENKEPQWEEAKRLVRERDEATEKYERLRKELEESAALENASSSSGITTAQTTIPPPRYDEIEGSRAPGGTEKTSPPMQHLEACIPKVQAMLNAINDMQRTLGEHSRDYVKEAEIRNLWSVYWSMNDKMTDTLRKLESEHKDPKEVHYTRKYSGPKPEVYTETITWTRPTVENRVYSIERTSEDSTLLAGETLDHADQRRSCVTRPPNVFEDSTPTYIVPESRSWRPPAMQFTEEDIARPEPMNMPGVMDLPGETTETTEPGESSQEKDKEDVVEELLREWTTIYD